MNKVSKKLVSVALTATTTLWLTGAAAFVPAAAQSTADLQAQIAALLAQITVLQSKLGSSGSSMSYTFAKDLTLGSKGADVTNLQQVLNSKGYLKVSPTGYFGPATKAALVEWQKAAGVSPASGYFGPKSRAAMNAAMAGGSGSGSGSVGGVVPPASGLAVSLAADSPTGSAIAGAGQIKVGKFNFTASNAGGVTVTDLQFTKVGVLSDSNIQNLYLADAQTGMIVAQYQSLTNGVATFSGLALNVMAGQTWQGELRMDMSTGATAGNTIAWQLSKVTTSGNGAVTGMPTTNALTVTSVSNPALASLALSANAVGSSIDAGTVSALVSSWTANVGSSAVNLQNMQFTFVGSANPSDVKNLRLLVNGTEVAKLDSAASVTNFNFADKPVKLNTGNATIQIFGDVLGSPNRTFTFSLLQPYRVTAIDTQYNTGVTVTITTTNQTTITINSGTMSVSLSSNTPTAPVPNGASNVTLAKFRVYAAGEPVKVMWLDATITKTGGTNFTSSTANLTNVKLIDDAGGQFGNTINTISSGGNSGQCGVAAAVLTCHFGTSGSPVNYIVPANTSRELSLVVDIATGNDVTTLQGGLATPASTNNLQGQISYQTATSGAASGATLQVSTSALTPTVNSAFSAPTYVGGANAVKVASFVLTASSAQGAQVTSLTFAKTASTTVQMQNVKVMVGSTQFGSTRTTISNTGSDTLAVSGATPIQVAAGGSVVVDVYADLLTTSSAGTTTANVFSLTGWSALGSVSNSSISFPGTVNGQSVIMSSGPTLTIGKASASAPAQQVVMGSTNNSLFTLSLSANNVEDVRVTDVTLLDTITGNAAGIASFQNLSLYNGTTLVAGPLSLAVPGTSSGTVHFTMGSPVVVPKNSSVNLELRGDVATFSSGGAQSGSGHTFSVAATSSVTALGNSSNQAATVSGTPGGSAATVYRTKVTLASSLLGSSAGRTRVAVDDVANLNFSADTAYKAVLGTVTLKFSGQAVTSGTTAFNVDLIDANTNADIGSATTTLCTPTVGNQCSVTFYPQFSIDAGTTKTVKVRVNSGSFANNAQTSDSLSVIVNATGDVLIDDGSTGSVPLPGTVVPFTVVNVSYE